MSNLGGQEGIVELDPGRPGIAPLSRSSRLGWVAAVIATLSPSQLKPAVSQRIAISGEGAATPAGALRGWEATGMGELRAGQDGSTLAG
jgi:hypothetical protein